MSATNTGVSKTSADDDSVLLNRFAALCEAVYAKRPVLKEIVRKHGKKMLYDYAKEYIDVNLNPPIQRRQEELISTFKEEVAKRLGEKVAAEAAVQLEKHYYVSTADHHGPICHPFFINSNLVTAAPYFEHDDQDLKYVIVLPCANISFDNSSFPRGLVYHSSAKGDKKMHQLGFFPRNVRPCPVFNFRSYTREDIDRSKKMLIDSVREGELLSEESDQLHTLLDEIYLQPEVLACDRFSDQLTKTNFALWKRFFHTKGKVPDLIYLEQESFVIQLLLKYHINADTIISHILFDRTYDSLIAHYFDNIMGAFSLENKWGTYLFWGLPKDGKYRVQMWKDGDRLVSSDGTFSVELTPGAIKKALEKREIYPSTLLDFIVLSFYYGLKCLGGFSQVNYLTYMKNAYIKMQVDKENYRSIEVCARAQTKEIGGDLTIAFLQGANGELTPATGVDLILKGNEHTWAQLSQESRHISLEEALNPMMPDFYRIIYPEEEREESLLAITPEDIARITNLDKKIHACASF